MRSISRRGFVISAATAGAAFGLYRPLEFVGAAFAQASPDAAAVTKFKVGDIEVIQLFDGVWEKAHDPGWVKNASLMTSRPRSEPAATPTRTCQSPSR